MSLTAQQWARIQYFTEDEMTCKCGCGQAHMDYDYMVKLDWARRNAKFKMIVNSGYRCPGYDKAIGGAGVHPTGKAADIRIYGFRLVLLKQLVCKKNAGFTGFGEYQKGDWLLRFLHLDDLLNHETFGPRPWCWTY